MSDSLKINVGPLRRLAAALDSDAVKGQIQAVPQEKAIAALIGQAIADNFAKEGPGWAPLKASSIRQSLSHAMKKKLVKGKHNTVAVKKGGQQVEQQARRILQRTNLLMKTATTPLYSGANKSGQTGQNIYKVEGQNIIWGTDLIYARIHNRGGVIRHPGTNNGFGIKGLKIPAHSITIPKREFLVLHEEWKRQIFEFVLTKYRDIITKAMKAGGALK